MRTCWLGCRDREREREREDRGCYALAGSSPFGVNAAARERARLSPAAPRPVSRPLAITCVLRARKYIRLIDQ